MEVVTRGCTVTMSQREYRVGAAPATNQTIERERVTLTSASMPNPVVRPAPGTREQRWFHEHETEMIGQYGGRWIAVSGDTVLGAGNDALEAHEQAKARGFPNAALILVPGREGEWDKLVF